MITKEYNASPTAAQFHNCDKFFRYVQGPVGSGKSTMCVIEIIRRAMMQTPHNGVRRSRWAVVRSTYPQLKTTTINTWKMWVPESVAPIVYSSPIVAKMNQPLADGTRLELEVLFLALDNEEDVNKLTSIELSGAYFNECREIPETLVETMKGRVGRYPAVTEGGCTFACIIADSNPPKTSHWLYEKFEGGNIPDSWAIFKQPPAVVFDVATEKWEINLDAENLAFLPPRYYELQLDGANDDYIKVMLAGEYGMTRQGKPIFSTFRSQKHVAKTIIQPIRGLPVLLSFDFGLSPGCTFMQQTNRGIRLIDELPGQDESLEDFIEHYVAPLVQKKYVGFKLIGTGDPAGSSRSDVDKRTRFQVLLEKGIKAFPAITNKFSTRKEAVDFYLSRDEGFIISPHCQWSVEAMGGGYVFKEVKNSKGLSTDVPLKNEYSHIADCIQYGALYFKYGYKPTAIGRAGRDGAEKAAKQFLWA